MTYQIKALGKLVSMVTLKTRISRSGKSKKPLKNAYDIILKFLESWLIWQNKKADFLLPDSQNQGKEYDII